MEVMLGKQILNQAKQESRTQLTEIESKEFLRESGIPVIETKLARTKKEAISASKELGFPVVLKVVSPDIIHKSDSGGVRLGLTNVTQVGNAYSEIMLSIRHRLPEARVQGVAVQKMARPGVEVIIGMSKDAQFGPVLMFGLGGISFLEQLIVKVSELVEQYPQIRELDLNPVFAYRDGAIAVDARIVLEAAVEN